MHKRALVKPDGRALFLFGREPFGEGTTTPSPSLTPHAPNPHLRWHPLRAEWVAYAGHRQARTFLPPAEFNPLAPTRDSSHPTEVPAGSWDVAVFENLFPTFASTAHAAPDLPVRSAPAAGVCEVVVFTQDPRGALGRLPLWHLELLLEVWADRYKSLGSRPEVQYVFPFENRGVEVGVTLPHPHGQIYAYPFIPPIPARALEQERAYFDRHGRGLVEDLVQREVAEGVRVIHRGERVSAFVPVFARYAFEVWVAPHRRVAALPTLTCEERADFARALKAALLKLDGLWQRPMPYILAFYQAPTDGGEHLETHVRVEIYPALRMRDRLKYLAGSEIGAGVFTADTLPERSAMELRGVAANVDE